jgi:hypothetical protein
MIVKTFDVVRSQEGENGAMQGAAKGRKKMF